MSPEKSELFPRSNTLATTIPPIPLPVNYLNLPVTNSINLKNTNGNTHIYSKESNVLTKTITKTKNIHVLKPTKSAPLLASTLRQTPNQTILPSNPLNKKVSKKVVHENNISMTADSRTLKSPVSASHAARLVLNLKKRNNSELPTGTHPRQEKSNILIKQKNATKMTKNATTMKTQTHRNQTKPQEQKIKKQERSITSTNKHKLLDRKSVV